MIGTPRDDVVREIGLLKRSVTESWPGAGKGAVLHYDNFESTRKPVVVLAGSDVAGALAAGRRFLAEFSGGIDRPRGFTFWPTSTGTKLYPYMRPPKGVPDKIAIEMAKGEYEPAQVVITAYDKITDLDVSVAPLVHARTGRPMSNAYVNEYRKRHGPVWLRWVNYSPVGNPGGWSGYPDPLLERPETELAEGQSQALWLTVVVPETAEAGVYRSSITCVADGRSKTLPIEVKVWDFTVPRDGLRGEGYTYYSTGDTEDAIRALARNYAEHGIRTIHVRPVIAKRTMLTWQASPEGAFKGKDTEHVTVNDDGTIAMDASGLDWLVETCDDSAKPFGLRYMTYIQVLAYKDGKGHGIHNFLKKIARGKFDGLPKREGHWYQDRYMQMAIALFKKHLEKKGWLDRFVLKISDEPAGFDFWYDRHTAGAREVGMPFMTCFNSINWKEAERGLGKLGVWQPLYMHYNKEFFQKARDAGGLIGWYNCGPPPRSTNGVPASELRGYLWQAAKADLDIVCWWGIQTGKPAWNDRFAHWNQVMYWPEHPSKPSWDKPGKGRVDTVPIDGTRWELIRDGMEDAWYVNELRRRIARARKAGRSNAADKAQAVLDGIWRDVFPTLNDYKPPYDDIMASRRKVAEAILELGR